MFCPCYYFPTIYILSITAYFLFRFSIIFSRFMTEGAFISAISAIHFVALPRLLKRDGVNNVKDVSVLHSLVTSLQHVHLANIEQFGETLFEQRVFLLDVHDVQRVVDRHPQLPLVEV